MSGSPPFFRHAFAGLSAIALAAALAASGCSSTETASGGSGGRGPTGGTSGTGGMAATGGTGGSGGSAGTGGSGGGEPAPLPTPGGPTFDSGGATIKSDSYEMDVSIGGPLGKGTADSAMYMLDYYVPTSPER